MRRFHAARETEPPVGTPDRWLLWIPLGLTAAGLVLVYSASSILGLSQHADAWYYVSRQAVRALIGLVLLVVVARLDYRRLGEKSLWIFGLTLAGLAVMAVLGAGSEVRGAKRWVGAFGLVFQPTEMARVTTLIFLAWFLARREDVGSFTRTYVPALGIVGLAAGMVAVQPNLSSAAVLFAAGGLLLYFAGARLMHLAATVGVGLLGFVAMISRYDYQRERLMHHVQFLFTGKLDTLGSGWQLDQSLIAFGSGGLFGRGFGRGMQKFLFLPDPHTDFILAIAGEEGGFLATGAFVLAYLLLIWRGYRCALRAADPFGRLLAAGLTTQLALYAFVNMGVATGLLPTTGLPLPFVSYGGSALVMNLIAVGVLISISARGDAVLPAMERRRTASWPTLRTPKRRPAWEALR